MRVHSDGNRVEMLYQFLLAGPFYANLGPAIDGEISFETISGSDSIEFCESRDPYPSLEVYQFVNGETRRIVREHELPLIDPSKSAKYSLSNRAPNFVGCYRS
jgi:hypothetical protein